MNELKPGDKVLVKATVNMQYKQHVSLYQQCGIPNYAWHVPISSIHRDPTKELERLRASVSHFSGLLGEETEKRYALEEENKRLRAYVENEYCYCYAINPCARCKALGKERS